LKQANENIITITIAMVTNNERLGNSACDNDEIVSSIKKQSFYVRHEIQGALIAASRMPM